MQVEHTYTGALDTELAQAMFECDPEVSIILLHHRLISLEM